MSDFVFLLVALLASPPSARSDSTGIRILSSNAADHALAYTVLVCVPLSKPSV
jgi:hypothetical protein